MKKLILIIAIVLGGMLMQAQDNLKWDVVIEQQGSKQELYDKMTFVIADLYNSSNNVVQLSNPEQGIIIKASSTAGTKVNMGMHYVNYHFDYTLKILLKDGKYRVLISNITEGSPSDYRYKTIPAIENFKCDMWKFNINSNQHARIMNGLKSSIHNLVTRIEYRMQEESLTNSDW